MKTALIVIICAFSPLFLHGQSQVQEPSQVPTQVPAQAPAQQAPTMQEIRLETGATWSVGFAKFSGTDLSREHEYLLTSVPLLLKSELDTIKMHYFDAETKEIYRKSLVYERLRVQYAELQKLQKERDELIFGTLTADQIDKKEAELDARITTTLETISTLKNYDTATIEFPDFLPVSIRNSEKNEILYAAPKYSIFQFARDNKINLFITGTVREVQGYLVISVNALDSTLEKNSFSYSKVLGADELPDIAKETKKGLARTLLGTDWAALILSVEPANSIVFMDDEFVGIGTMHLDFIRPGDKKIRVEAPGYFPEEKRISFDAKADMKIEFNLVREDVSLVHVESNPSGADVYINSVWSGKTPIDIEKNLSIKRVLLTMKGYDDYSFHVDITTGQQMSVALIEETINKNTHQAVMRDNFYSAFGFFLISIALPVFSYGYYFDFMTKAVEVGETSEDYERFRLFGEISYGTFWGTLALTGILGINMLIHFIQYIVAADRPFG